MDKKKLALIIGGIVLIGGVALLVSSDAEGSASGDPTDPEDIDQGYSEGAKADNVANAQQEDIVQAAAIAASTSSVGNNAVLQKAQEFVSSGTTASSCWDWVEAVFRATGYEIGRGTRNNIKKLWIGSKYPTWGSAASETYLPNLDLLIPGDWLFIYTANKYGTGDHSVIFAGWQDRNYAIAKTYNLPVAGKAPVFDYRNLSDTQIGADHPYSNLFPASMENKKRNPQRVTLVMRATGAAANVAGYGPHLYGFNRGGMPCCRENNNEAMIHSNVQLPSSPNGYSLHDPRYNKSEIIKQICLLEDHFGNPLKRCPDCIHKHFYTAEGLAEEMVSLGGALYDPSVQYLPGFLQHMHHRSFRTDPLQVQAELRAIRKHLTSTI